jgi:hypothetical protein
MQAFQHVRSVVPLAAGLTRALGSTLNRAGAAQGAALTAYAAIRTPPTGERGQSRSVPGPVHPFHETPHNPMTHSSGRGCGGGRCRNPESVTRRLTLFWTGALCGAAGGAVTPPTAITAFARHPNEPPLERLKSTSPLGRSVASTRRSKREPREMSRASSCRLSARSAVAHPSAGRALAASHRQR